MELEGDPLVYTKVDLEEIPEVWTEFKYTLRNCSDCRVDSTTFEHGDATSYELCEPHRQELHRHYVLDSSNELPVPIETKNRGVKELIDDFGDADDNRSLRVEARRLIADPTVDATPLCEPGLKTLEADFDEYTAGTSLERALRVPLAELAITDENCRSQVHDRIKDTDNVLCGPMIRVVEEVAWLEAEAVTDEILSSLCRALVYEESGVHKRALGALLPLSRTYPNTIAKIIDPQSATQQLHVRPRQSFNTLLFMGQLSQVDKSFITEVNDVIENVLSGDDDRLRAAGAAALGYAQEMSGLAVRKKVRPMFDPTRYDEHYLREAAVLLKKWGRQADVELLKCRLVNNPDRKTERVIDSAISALEAN